MNSYLLVLTIKLPVPPLYGGFLTFFINKVFAIANI